MELEATKGIVDRRIYAKGTIVKRMVKKNRFWGKGTCYQTYKSESNPGTQILERTYSHVTSNLCTHAGRHTKINKYDLMFSMIY